MKLPSMNPVLLTLLLAGAWQAAAAQFDDVYYQPDDPIPGYSANAQKNNSVAPGSDVLYYDDSAYPYYGDSQQSGSGYGGDDWDYYGNDYDYYYSSCIRRFNGPFVGVDFFAPIYTGFHVYDPWAWDAYYYPGASIYFSFGSYGYYDYYRWRNYQYWNRWGGYGGWNNWCYTPQQYFYAYNAWCPPTYSYWGWGPQYYTYSNYYNNYYNGCPGPVSYYNGITNTTVHVVGQGNTRGSYYGPRVTGNTGTSPRGPVQTPGITQPVFKDGQNDVAESNDGPRGLPLVSTPGVALPQPDPGPANGNPKVPKEANSGDVADGVRQVPVDREIPKEPGGSKRPVFKPESDRYVPRPYTPSETVTSSVDKQPDAQPYTPRYTPPTASKPSGNPQARQPRTYNEERSSYRPGPTEESRSSYRPAPRTEDKPSQAPRSHEPSSRQESPSYSPPRSDSRPSGGGSSGGSSGSSNRSSGGGGGSSSPSRTSPRGGG